MKWLLSIVMILSAVSAFAFSVIDPEYVSDYQLRLEHMYGKGYPPGVPDDPPVTHNYDVQYYDIAIDVDTVDESIDAVVGVTVEFTENGVTTLELQLIDEMPVSSVKKDGSLVLAYTHSNDIIDITLDGTYNTGDEIIVVIEYSGDEPPEGLYFQSNGTIHTISWPDYAHNWFPCYDAPWDKSDDGCILRITIPATWEVAAVGTRDTKATYDFIMDFPISTYNIAWNTREQYEFFNQSGGPTECPTLEYAVYPEDLADAQIAFANMPTALNWLADTFGTWPFTGTKFGIVEVPLSGGMEHPTCISIGHNFIPGSTTWESLYVHEAAHMWYGDSVGLDDWRDFWMSEGFASYTEALWDEESSGESAYHSAMSSFRSTYKNEDNNNRFAIYNPEVMLSATVYHKGAWVLHMLRHVMGDDQDFFDALAEYYSTYAHGNAVTEDFITIAESYYGSDLDWFFDEWIYMAGYPEYDYKWTANVYGGKGSVDITIYQIQDIDSITPMFTMPIDILVTTTDSEETFTVTNNAEIQSFNLPLTITGTVTDVELDPDEWVLCDKRDATDVTLISFNAVSRKSGVELRWEAEEDEHLVGYDIFRSVVAAEPREDKTERDALSGTEKQISTKINEHLIIGRNPYSFMDTTADPAQTYTYELKAVYETIAESLGMCENQPIMPTTFELIAAYPNPANNIATFAYVLPISSEVKLELFDISGRKVATVVEGVRSAGINEERVELDLSGGVYLYRLTAGNDTAVKKIIITK